jgi:hypothetical protein
MLGRLSKTSLRNSSFLTRDFFVLSRFGCILQSAAALQ